MKIAVSFPKSKSPWIAAPSMSCHLVREGANEIHFELELGEFVSVDQSEGVVLDNTRPDKNGRIVFTASKGLPGVGFSRAEWASSST